MKQPEEGTELVTTPTSPVFWRTTHSFETPAYGCTSSLVSPNLHKAITPQTPRTPMIPRTLPLKSNCEKSIGAPFRVLVGKGWRKGGGGKRGLLGKASLYA